MQGHELGVQGQELGMQNRFLRFMPLACDLHTGFDARKPFESKSCKVTDDEELADVTLRQFLGVSQVIVDLFSQCRPIANVTLATSPYPNQENDFELRHVNRFPL